MAKKRVSANATYDVTFEGTYFKPAMVGGGNELGTYSETVPMTQEIIDSCGSPLAAWKGHYSHIIMERSEKYPNFAGLHTYEVIKATRTDSDEPIEDLRLLVRHELIEFIEDNSLPVECHLYEDNGSLRHAIQTCEADETGFLKTQELIKERRGPHVSARDSIEKLLRETLSSKPKAETPLPSKVGAGKSKSKSDDLGI